MPRLLHQSLHNSHLFDLLMDHARRISLFDGQPQSHQAPSVTPFPSNGDFQSTPETLLMEHIYIVLSRHAMQNPLTAKLFQSLIRISLK
jgi:hypothetical protein